MIPQASRNHDSCAHWQTVSTVTVVMHGQNLFPDSEHCIGPGMSYQSSMWCGVADDERCTRGKAETLAIMIWHSGRGSGTEWARPVALLVD